MKVKALENQKVVLAYSGGLDTSVILKWLIEQKFEVICLLADVGQRENLPEVKEKAYKIGAFDVVVSDLKRDFVTDYIFPAIKAGGLYEGRYLLGTPLARPLIAKEQIRVAHQVGARIVSHGATGKGNDQVRFELSYYALDPTIQVIAPWKDRNFLNQFKGRPDMLAYAEKHGLPVKATIERPYSEDGNLMHISHEGGILEDPSAEAKDMREYIVHPKDAPDRETRLTITFKDGAPIRVMDHQAQIVLEDPLEFFNYLNKIGGENGIGLVDMVENRFVGIKSRGVYETPAGTILHIAHRDIEGLTMDREVMRLRDSLSPKFSECVYNGFWFSPEMDFILSAINKSQELIDGDVTLALYKGNVMVLARQSDNSLYNQDLSSMDNEGGFDQTDAEGFIRINAIRLKAHHAIVQKNKGEVFWDKS
jgi:argininosuccinate synthase